jgi:hypothetical protein
MKSGRSLRKEGMIALQIDEEGREVVKGAGVEEGGTSKIYSSSYSAFTM